MSPTSWQMLVRGLVIAAISYLFTGYEVPQWPPFAISAGVGLLLAAILGLQGAWRCWPAPGAWLRLADGVLDLIGGVAVMGTAIGAPLLSAQLAGLWAILAGGGLIVHALPTPLRDDGPPWAWLWTGIPLAMLGLLILVFPETGSPTVALTVGTAGLIGATMLSLLGLNLTDPEVLTMPEVESAAETAFTCNQITWRRTGEPPEEPRKSA
jgi:uncharacterized membrane protein HdeD (DUF308 family)